MHDHEGQKQLRHHCMHGQKLQGRGFSNMHAALLYMTLKHNTVDNFAIHKMLKYPQTISNLNGKY